MRDAGVDAEPPERLAASFEGFEEFVAAQRPRLLRVACLIVGDRDLAEDLLHDALMKLAGNWKRIHSDPFGYVRTIIYRDAISWRRRRREFTCSWLPDRAGRDEADESAVRLAFAGALAKLTAKQRAVLLLRYYEDLPVLAAAEILGVSAGTVKSQTNAALARLREVAPELGELIGRGEESR